MVPRGGPHPEVSAALDAAQDRAAEQIIGWVAAHATTRVGPRGRQVQVPVEQIEAAVIRHYTSRASDPHRHLHLQINARVFAASKWRGIHSVAMRDSLEAINGIGHAAVATDPGFRSALAEHGFTFDPVTGEIPELATYAAQFSARAAQIGRNVDRYEAEWRAEHPGEEPGPRLRQAWDRRAWSQARPDKVVPQDGAAMVAAWSDDLRQLGFRDPSRRTSLSTPRIGVLDREAAVELVVSRLGAKRSAWNAADIRGQVEQWIAATGTIAEASVRVELAEDLTARALKACTPLLTRDDVPEHIRALSSPRVIGVEDRITRLLGMQAAVRGGSARLTAAVAISLDPAQRNAVAALAGTNHLLVVEGAAGAGKTATLAATKIALAAQGRRMMVVTPTLKAAEVAAGEITPRRSRRRGSPISGDGAGTTTATGPAPATSPPTQRRCSTAVTCSWSTRPGCSIRTPPARSWRSRMSVRHGWRSWATVTNSRRSVVAGSSTSPPNTPEPTRSCPWMWCIASPTRITPS